MAAIQPGIWPCQAGWKHIKPQPQLHKCVHIYREREREKKKKDNPSHPPEKKIYKWTWRVWRNCSSGSFFKQDLSPAQVAGAISLTKRGQCGCFERRDFKGRGASHSAAAVASAAAIKWVSEWLCDWVNRRERRWRTEGSCSDRQQSNPTTAAAAWAALASMSSGAERHQAGLSARSHRVFEQTRHLISSDLIVVFCQTWHYSSNLRSPLNYFFLISFLQSFNQGFLHILKVLGKHSGRGQFHLVGRKWLHI